MKLFIINTDYPDFVRLSYARQPGLKRKPWSEQMRIRAESLFGMADFYSRNLGELGHTAIDIIANHQPLQRQWAAENGMDTDRTFKTRDWVYHVLEAQIKQFQPEIIYTMAMETTTSEFLKALKERYNIKLIVGQHAAPLTAAMADLSGYDLILSSLPNLVEYFRAQGKQSEYFKLGFEPAVLAQLSGEGKKRGVVFIGGISTAHAAGTKVLEELVRVVPVDFWGYGLDSLEPGSPIRSRHHGPAWGKEMYHILYNSRISLNRHIDIAENYANNMRLYETTGTGALLITDYKQNLAEIFEIGKEIVAYHSGEDLIEKVRYYWENEAEGKEIARAGQTRTLSEHTYLSRMKELVEIVAKYM